jgi:hypothetical protein
MKKLILMFKEVEFAGQNVIMFKVQEQSHISHVFHDGRFVRRFIASDGFVIQSINRPQMNPPDKLHVRGEEYKYNDRILVCKDLAYWKRVVLAVQQYNFYHNFTGKCFINNTELKIPDMFRIS